MISIPAYLLLGVFSIIVLIMTGIIGAQLYHGYRFGKNDPVTMAVNTSFVVAIVAVLVFTVILLLPVDWAQSFDVNQPDIPEIPSGNSLQLPTSPGDIPSIITTP